MINTFIGNLGHLSVIVAFVSAILASVGYFMHSRTSGLQQLQDQSWRSFGRAAFLVHVVAVLSVIGSLFYIIYTHSYEYYYAWSHSSNHLPTHFMISCFWEGQEGSFLLWIFWHSVLGLALIKFARQWEGPVMAVFAFVQVFLTSMILGVVIGELKIGSSPFILLRDFMPDAPVFKLDPNFIPKDGTGLNPLLQNYWMVIHPPVLFLGFAATLVPFAFAIAGLWRRQFTDWVKPALGWGLFAAAVLGLGTMMGAYWAYETLNFGGYWNWDPVENAVYIPWLVLVGGLHCLVAFQRSKSGLRAGFMLIIASFLLILYATFLTRSGILGNASVHSFTDLGLSGQLLVYLLAFAVLSKVLLFYRWKHIPATDKELSTYNGAFWMFIGATVLCLGAFQVFVTTSIPVYNAFVGLFGIESNMALPADQVAHYTKFQLWMGVAIALLTGIGQILWWKKIDRRSLMNAISLPMMLTLLSAALIMLLVKMSDLKTEMNFGIFVILLTTSLFAVFANLATILRLLKKNFHLSGGAVSHIGIALMLIGILFSAGYSNIISQNTSGLLYSRDFPEEVNRDNVLLWRNTPSEMAEFKLVYKGQRFEVEGIPGFVNKGFLFPTDDIYKAIARTPLMVGDKVYAEIGDTVEIDPINTYYEVEYTTKEGKTFSLFPRAQVNEQMGLLASPDILTFPHRDIYTHVSTIPDPEEETKWSEMTEHEVAIGDTIFLNDYFAVLKGLEPVKTVPGVTLAEGDVAVQAAIIVYGEEGKTYHAHPIFMIKDQMVGRLPETIEDLGLKLTFINVDPDKGKFTLGVSTTQKDYIIMKAIEKPFIAFLWIGTIVMTIGFVIAIVRRANERDVPNTTRSKRARVAA